MNKNIKLAVAGAVLALSASAANAGIVIPAGEWTVDIGGNVNTYYSHTTFSGNLDKTSANVITTGLLPTALGIGAKSRQNDLDVAVQFSLFTGVNSNGNDNLNVTSAGVSNGGLGYNSLNIRQAYLTVGDKSLGTLKFGRDLGVFGSDAILSDMTLLGVGSGAGGSNSSTLGRIGSGYIYADWLAQIAYTTPNFNGFEATGSIHENLGSIDNNELGYSGKASYSFAAADATGKIWVEGTHHKIQSSSSYTKATSQNGVYAPTTGSPLNEADAEGYGIGAKVGYAGAELVGYYYNGKNMDSGIGTAINTATRTTTGAFTFTEHDNNGGYVQATYVLPTKTKVGVSWGKNIIEAGSGQTLDSEREAWVVGAYHPLTKSLNLVAEYNHLETKNTGADGATLNTAGDGKAKTVSLGAILFF